MIGGVCACCGASRTDTAGQMTLARAAAECEAAEYGPAGLRINSVGPGYIDTPAVQAVSAIEGAHEALVAKHPLGRLGRPEEIATVVRFLLSEDASFVTGAYWKIDGGYTTV